MEVHCTSTQSTYIQRPLAAVATNPIMSSSRCCSLRFVVRLLIRRRRTNRSVRDVAGTSKPRPMKHQLRRDLPGTKPKELHQLANGKKLQDVRKVVKHLVPRPLHGCGMLLLDMPLPAMLLRPLRARRIVGMKHLGGEILHGPTEVSLVKF